MSKTPKFFAWLALIVIGFYLGLTYLPQIVGTCMDGECGFTTGEIAVSFALPLSFIALPIVLEMVGYRKNLAQALNDIGIIRFNWAGIRVALGYVAPLTIFLPLLAILTNSTVALQPHWEWRLVNILLVNGFAEEIMMRGFVFRHLRTGRTFWRAAALSTLFFAIYHLPIILSLGLVVGIMAVVVAIPLGFLTAYAYERGTNTIWGPALLHAANNALFMLFVFPEAIQATTSSLYFLFGIGLSIILCVRAYRKGYARDVVSVVPQAGVASA
ncbi:MAG: CPBP family intramembrane glutamic endopeptidase [Anaerolineae bacterium]